MPVIPQYQSQESVRVGGIDVNASPEDAGAGIGRELQGLGQQTISLAATVNQQQKIHDAENRDLTVANAAADTTIKFAKAHTNIQLKTPADGTGLTENTLAAQRQIIEDTAATIADPIARTRYRTEATGQLAKYGASNVGTEADMRLKAQQDASNASLDGLQNLVRADPKQYDQADKDGQAVIEGQTSVPANAKGEMKRNWTEQLATTRFDGMLENAKTLTDFDAIKAELTDPKNDWQAKFKPANYDTTLDKIDRAKAAFNTLADQQARAAIESAKARTKDLVQIDPTELGDMMKMAENSANPVTLDEAHRIQRDQQILAQGAKLSASELTARSNEIKAGGYPGMPDEINKSINVAAQLFPDVNSAVYGGTIVQEYGQYLPKGVVRKGATAFAPRGVGANVDFRNVNPAAMNAATLAGQIFGQPLQVISGYRSQARQNALRFAPGKNPFRATIAKDSQHTHGDAFDFSTTGMSEPQKAKMVDALLQAGFTRFGEYSTHIHADMLPITPKNFNASTRNLGWTTGSPEVVGALTARGYGPAMQGGKIQRGDAGVVKQNVDYTHGTGSGTTSATGPGQFINATWLSLVKDPEIQRLTGIDTKLSDAQLLELRKDPYWATLMIGAEAHQNKKTLEASLGRPVNDAELYMAHFLGPQGAQLLISSYTRSPDAIAADMMPQAATNNKARFYKDGKPLSVKDVYDNIATQFSTAPTQVQYGDAKTYENMGAAAAANEKSDPMGQYGNRVAPNNNLDAPGGYATRGATATAAAGLYHIPLDEMKPFTVDEAAALTKQLSDGTVEQQLTVMRNLQTMDQAAPGMAKAAYAQLGQKDTALAHAADIANERGDPTTAEQIVRGTKRLKDDKTLEPTLFGKDSQNAIPAFNSATSMALLGVSGEARNAVFNSAKAIYAEKAAASGNLTFDNTAFTAAVQQATGGMGDVNGHPTILPPGITAETFSTAVDKLNDADLIKLSEDGRPPLDITGGQLNAKEVAYEAEFVYVDGTSYKVRMNDHTYLTTGERDADGMVKWYMFNADPKALKDIAARPEVVQPHHVIPSQSITDPTQTPGGGWTWETQ